MKMSWRAREEGDPGRQPPPTRLPVESGLPPIHEIAVPCGTVLD